MQEDEIQLDIKDADSQPECRGDWMEMNALINIHKALNLNCKNMAVVSMTTNQWFHGV